MLVLTRRKNESIIINENIEITIVAVEGDQIKLGIQAPKDIDIYRKEVYLQIQTENNEAAQNPVDLMALLKHNTEK
ncbi:MULTISPECIES: carbon storage regulator CsrA [Cytobacillus]|uniref:carbon storage regulator CsrA n=1 Tax=Cytobacillus TaxID=2675230 RepID=UPI00203E9FF7|nr:carbon storage regulator CsrA [Cytobacillus kochii]MCM3322767.1 carbon storage regulator CsrA [Cytobacillus kochii]MCM3344754.1 carbon storage regulator CsrA [Cytobacillus kochii]MDM5209297.1 carbon storage regulator CsrA [Cytobacillus kochii]MDQ0188106.1 carbon storage regulator [Cytobacillus kochii]